MKIASRHLLLTTALLTSACGVSSVIAQTVDLQVLDAAAMEIQKKNQNLSHDVLARDRDAIQAAYPAIKANLSMKGFSNVEVTHAVVSGWKQMRVTTPVGFLNEQVFRSQISKLGMLRIESEPRDATIVINANRHDERTNTMTWLAPGSYRIVIEKPGYISVEEERAIVEGKNPPLKKTLRRRLK